MKKPKTTSEKLWWLLTYAMLIAAFTLRYIGAELTKAEYFAECNSVLTVFGLLLLLVYLMELWCLASCHKIEIEHREKVK